MAGRPPNTDRQNAIALGLTTYQGAPHAKCGTTERYTKGGGCVHCARLIAEAQREALKTIIAQGRETVLDTEPVIEVDPHAQSIEDLM